MNMSQYYPCSGTDISIKSLGILFLSFLPTTIHAISITGPSAAATTSYPSIIPDPTPTSFDFTIPSSIPTSTIGNVILRPSAGETITAGTPYTITWTALYGETVELELNDNAGSASWYGPLCAGWAVNPKCGAITPNFTDNTGRWVWDVPAAPGVEYININGPKPGTYWISLQATDPWVSVGWYPVRKSGEFWIWFPGEDSVNASSSSYSSTTTISSGINSIPVAATAVTGATSTTGKSGTSTPTSSSAAASNAATVFEAGWIVMEMAILFQIIV